MAAKKYRINGFKQMKGFFTWVSENQKYEIHTTHISLYMFLLCKNNDVKWAEWFVVPYEVGMHGSCVGNRNTYYKCLNDMKEWGIIGYRKGVNEHSAPKISLRPLGFDTATDTPNGVANGTASGDAIGTLPIPLVETQL